MQYQGFGPSGQGHHQTTVSSSKRGDKRPGFSSDKAATRERVRGLRVSSDTIPADGVRSPTIWIDILM